MKILIVGGVAGGASAAARLRRLNEKAEIILFERGEYISFANCGLPYYIGGEIKEKSALTLQTPESFNATFRVDVRVQNEVTAIDREAKSVLVTNLMSGEKYTESYDKLILSPGAAPILPNLPGFNSSRVFTLRNIPDTYKIKNYIDSDQPQSAVVVGGGYIGVEMAENLRAAGLAVTVVEMVNQVIAPLDYDMACDVHNHMRQKGVNLLLSNGVQAIEENDNGLTITLTQGALQADMLIMAVGVKPETRLAKEAGLELNARGGIIVNEQMQTSDENIYAVGDAVEVTDFVTGEKAMIPLA
ncbi:MAG: FAD-dependent oxidoreductase, partial [Firmicutes bacterium]|nr:FAD-dependent oxidoreductase [Bacillota bacterium]